MVCRNEAPDRMRERESRMEQAAAVIPYLSNSTYFFVCLFTYSSFFPPGSWFQSFAVFLILGFYEIPPSSKFIFY